MAFTWQDNSAIAKNLNYPRCLYDGYLVSWDISEAKNANGGTLLSDGIHARMGGIIASVGTPIPHLGYGFKDAGLFAVVAPSTNKAEIQKSVDGFADFTVVLPDPGDKSLSTIQRSLVDCGRHTLDDGDGNFAVERRVLIYFEYGASGECNAWYSAQPVNADAGNVGTWHELWAGDAVAIGHFHGGVYVYGKGLYVMTGDSDIASSILFCGDITSLIEFPATWFTRWGLAANARDAWGTDYHSAYVLGAGGQQWRTVDLVTADSRYLYFIPDSNPSSFTGGNRIIKVDIWDTTDSVAGTTSILKTGLSNYGWYGGASKSGLVYISNISYWATEDWAAGSNGKAEIWVIDPEDDSVELVKSFEPGKGYYDPARGVKLADGAWFGIISDMVDFGGAMCATMNRRALPEMGGALTTISSICGNVVKQKKVAPENMVSNNSFQTGDFTGFKLNSAMNKIGFKTGSVEIEVGDEVIGVDSGATATVSAVSLEGGSAWDGAGHGFISFDDDVDGVFEFEEVVKVLTVESAVVSGVVTREVIADPTGQIGGNVVRFVTSHSNNTEADETPTFLIGDLSAAQENILNGGFVNFSCKMYIAESVGAPKFQLQAAVFKGTANPSRADESEQGGEGNMYTQQWMTFNCSTVAAIDASLHWYGFNPNITASADVGVFYVTDFRLIKGALADAAIVQLDSGGGGGNRYSGGGRYGG